MSVDRSNEQTVNDNGITNSQKKNNEDNLSPGSSGRHSRNSRRSKDRSPRHKSRSDKGSSKKKKKDRSVTPKRGRSRSKSPDRQRSRHYDRSRDNRSSRDERRRDERVSKRDRKSSRRDRSRDRTPPSSSKRRYGRKTRRRRSTSSISSDDEISNLKQSSTLSGLLMKKEEKKPKSKRRRKPSSSSSSSSEDTRDGKPSVVNNAAVAESSQHQPSFAAPYMNQQMGFSVQAMPPPSSALPSYMPHSVLPSFPLIPPPLPPTIAAQPFYPPPPVPPPSSSMGSVSLGIPPPPLPPPAPRQHFTALPQVPRAPRPPRYNRPIVLNKTIREIDNSGNWGSGSVSNYNIVKQVGEGTYGQVYKADNDQGVRFALKKVRLDNEREGFPITAVREIKILRQLQHINVVQLKDIVTDQNSAADLRTNNANFYLVFEYVDHDLTGLLEAAHNKLIPDFLPSQIAVMFKQLLSGLQYCHSKKFLHRDIKCSNILVNNQGELKIADWGLARLYHDDHERLYTNRVITLWYRPPELLLGAEHYGPPVDVWSVGCILAEFFTKKAIFMGQHEAEQLLLISSLCGTPTPEVWPDVVNMPLYRTMKPKKMEFRRVKEEFSSIMPSAAIDLLDKMIMLDPKKRLTAADALKHQWIRHIDASKVPPLQLPCGQDCHELWSKKQKKERKSGIIPTGTLETKAVPVSSQPRDGMRRHPGPENNDRDHKLAFQGFSTLIANAHDPSNYKKAQDFLSSLSEANCQAIVQELVRQGQAMGLTESFGTGKQKLLTLADKIFGYSQPQYVVPPSYPQHPSLGHPALNMPPQQHRMHR